MKINEIQSFTTVVEAGSVQEAAQRLGLTQSAVSRLIQRLEDDIGAQLFDRSTKPFRLTGAGENALAHSRRVLRALDDFTSDFSDETKPVGPFRLGVTPALSAFAFRKPVEQIRKLYPDLSVSVSTNWSSEIVNAVRRGDLDAGVIVFEAARPLAEDVVTRRLTSERVRVIAPAEIAPPVLESVETMNRFGWVLLPDRCRYRAEIKRLLERSPEPLNVAVEAQGQELLISLVADGVGLGLAPESMLGEGPHRDKIRVVDVPALNLDVSFWLIRRVYPGPMVLAMETFEKTMVAQLSGAHSNYS